MAARRPSQDRQRELLATSSARFRWQCPWGDAVQPKASWGVFSAYVHTRARWCVSLCLHSPHGVAFTGTCPQRGGGKPRLMAAIVSTSVWSGMAGIGSRMSSGILLAVSSERAGTSTRALSTRYFEDKTRRLWAALFMPARAACQKVGRQVVLCCAHVVRTLCL